MLVYGIQARKGFVVLSGEVGTGKTTLLHALLSQLDPAMPSAFIFNPRLDTVDFLHMLFDEFGIEQRCHTKAEYLLALNHFLIECLKEDRTALVIIDEAQNLSPEMLEEVRLLSNLETPTSKLIQIMLVGQPELDTMIDRPDLRQLRQPSRCVTTSGPSTPRSSSTTWTSGCGLRDTREKASSSARPGRRCWP